MLLPRAAEAVVDIVKLTDYCLCGDHARGRHKARVFYAALGITATNAVEMQQVLRLAVTEHEAIPGLSDRFGTRYAVNFDWTRLGRTARIRSSWIVPTDGSSPRFITCFLV